MSVTSFWARYNAARDVFDVDREHAITILLSLADESLPHELYVRTHILLASATPDFDKSKECIKNALRMWLALRDITSPEIETVMELISELAEVDQTQRVKAREAKESARLDASSTSASPGKLEIAADLSDSTRRFNYLDFPRVSKDGRIVRSTVPSRAEAIGRIIASVSEASLGFRRVDEWGRVYDDDGRTIAYALPYRLRVDVGGRVSRDESVVVVGGIGK